MPLRSKNFRHIIKRKKPEDLAAKGGATQKTRKEVQPKTYPLEHPRSVESFYLKYDALELRDPDLAAHGISWLVKQFYKPSASSVCQCACSRCVAIVASASTMPPQIKASLWIKMSKTEKYAFVEAHGYEKGMKPKDRNAAYETLLQKGAFVLPVESRSRAPATAAAAATP